MFDLWSAKITEPCHLKRGRQVTATSIGSDQPAQSAQADLCRYFLLLAVNAKWTSLPHDPFASMTKWIFLWIYNYVMTGWYYGSRRCIKPPFRQSMVRLYYFFLTLPNLIVDCYTVKLLLNDQLRDHQKAVAEEKGSPNATKVHHTKKIDSI